MKYSLLIMSLCLIAANAFAAQLPKNKYRSYEVLFHEFASEGDDALAASLFGKCQISLRAVSLKNKRQGIEVRTSACGNKKQVFREIFIKDQKTHYYLPSTKRSALIMYTDPYQEAVQILDRASGFDFFDMRAVTLMPKDPVNR